MHILFGVIFLLSLIGCSSKCDEGCLLVSGEKIPFWDAKALVSQCDSFRNSSLRYDAVGLGFDEISKKTNNDPNTLLMSTYMNYMSISESPLVFERQTKNIFKKTDEIVQACIQLKQDFNNDRLWTKN